MKRSNEELRTILQKLTLQAKNSGASEFKAVTEYLTDCFESEKDNNWEAQELMMAICDEIIAITGYIKQKLS